MYSKNSKGKITYEIAKEMINIPEAKSDSLERFTSESRYTKPWRREFGKKKINLILKK
ncbi:MAG: hypothetical protein HQ569_04650 [Actinobacteria bacterium]|nr:hypothetical protein [Actinomycetota bacterium]